MKWFYFFVITLMFLLPKQNLLAGSPPTILSSYINNTAFALSDSYSEGTINTLNAGGIKNLYLTGLISDPDGYADIVNVKGVFYRSSVSGGYDCSTDKNNCYVVNSCSVQTVYGEPNQLNYSCEVPVYYFADATVSGGRYPSDNWLVYILVQDSEGTASLNTTNKELQELLALEIPENIDFGTMSLDQVTTAITAVETIIAQNGNVEASVVVYAPGSFVCSVRGTIPRGNLHWSLTAVDWAQGLALTDLPVDTTTTINYQDNDELTETDSLFWGLSVPASGLEGICTLVTVVSAIAK